MYGKGGSVLLDGVAHRVVERFNGVRLAHDRLLGPGTEGLECICESGHSSGIALLGNVIRVLAPEPCAVCASVRGCVTAAFALLQLQAEERL